MAESSALRVFTVGHSNLSPADFSANVTAHGVDLIVDVRSIPVSRMFPWFSQPRFAIWLSQRGLRYVYLGDRLGGRTRDPSLLLANGRPNFVRLAREPEYRAGIADLLGLV